MTKDHSLSVPKSERQQRDGVIIQIDFFEFHSLRVMIMVETTSSYMYARIVDGKTYSGTFDRKVHMIEQFIRELGKKIVTLQCDSEASLMKLVEGVAERFVNFKGTKATQINARFTAPHSSNSNGSVERAVRLVRDQVRVMFGALTHRFQEIFHPQSKFIQWLIRHSVWILNRVLIMKKQKKTRYELLNGRKFNRNNI